MNLAAALLLAFHLGSGEPAAEAAGAGEAGKEKLICKRTETTRSRMGSKRVCKTAAQWRDHARGLGESVEDMKDDPRIIRQ